MEDLLAPVRAILPTSRETERDLRAQGSQEAADFLSAARQAFEEGKYEPLLALGNQLSAAVWVHLRRQEDTICSPPGITVTAKGQEIPGQPPGNLVSAGVRGKSGTHMCWKEAFIYAQLFCCVGHYYMEDSFAAIQYLDTAFILGGPVAALQPMLGVLDERARAESQPFRKDLAPERTLEADLGSVPASFLPQLEECHSIPRISLEKLPSEIFFRHYVRTKTAIVITGTDRGGFFGGWL